MQQHLQRLVSACARLPAFWLKRVAMGVLLLLICQQLATLTWRLWFPTPLQSSEVALAPAHAKAPQTQAGAFTLFGRSPNAATLKPLPEGLLAGGIPLSSLQLTVTGILASRQSDRSIAIIAKDGRQFSRVVGDVVPGYEARIVTIFADRIVLENQGRYEALYLYRDDGTEPAPRGATAAPALGAVRDTLKQQPMKVMDYLAIVPQMKDNALAGYRLNPGKQPALFYGLGLKDNDVAVALNGLDLRDAQQGQQAMAQLPQLTDITLTIERDGQRQDIALRLDDAAQPSRPQDGAAPAEAVEPEQIAEE